MHNYSNILHENSWLESVKDGAWRFINQMQEDNFSYCKFSLKGDIYSKNDNWGLANLVFLTRILYVTGLLGKLDSKQKHNIYKNIIKHTKKNGYINDSIITNTNMFEKIGTYLNVFNKNILNNKIKQTKVAETRQSQAAIYLLGKKPLKIFKDLSLNEKQITKYVSSLDWSKPWNAGSHVNHLLFFLKMNSTHFSNQEEIDSNKMILFVIDLLKEKQNQNDGYWYSGQDVPSYEKINGAMKILNSLMILDVKIIHDVDKIIDFALKAKNEVDACYHFNIIYVLYVCSIYSSGYKINKIQDYYGKIVSTYKNYYWSDLGGFSFNINQSSKHLYGKNITKGLRVPDIHGTAMFIWGLSLIDKILNLNLNYKIPYIN